MKTIRRIEAAAGYEAALACIDASVGKPLD